MPIELRLEVGGKTYARVAQAVMSKRGLERLELSEQTGAHAAIAHALVRA